MAAVLTLVQIVLGVSSVMLGVPSWTSALHLANAVAILAMLLTITYRATVAPWAPARPAPDASPAAS
jgi:heme A synthase